MKGLVQVLAQGRRRSFQEGKFVVHECQCVVLGVDVQVGVLRIPERLAGDVLVEGKDQGFDSKGQPLVDQDGQPAMVPCKVLPAGAYELEYGLGVSWDKKEIGGVLKSIKRVSTGGNALLAALGEGAQGKPAGEKAKS